MTSVTAQKWGGDNEGSLLDSHITEAIPIALKEAISQDYSPSLSLLKQKATVMRLHLKMHDMQHMMESRDISIKDTPLCLSSWDN